MTFFYFTDKYSLNYSNYIDDTLRALKIVTVQLAATMEQFISATCVYIRVMLQVHTISLLW